MLLKIMVESSEFTSFPYKPGEKFKRNEMHKVVGGSFRHGMTSCNSGREFLLFHDAKKSKKFGYDIWEGSQADGSFHYSGQGTSGDQKMIKSNAALLTAHEAGKPIHLIETQEGTCTYLGRYLLGEPKYFSRLAPDVSMTEMRKIFVFNLVPTSSSHFEESSGKPAHGITRPWVKPEFSRVKYELGALVNREMIRVEFELQAAFGTFLITKNLTPFRHEFRIESAKGGLLPDMWIPSLKMIVEAKATLDRETLRLAVGQVLDYQELARLDQSQMDAFLLLPGLPNLQILEWMNSLGINVIHPVEGDFHVNGREFSWNAFEAN